MQAESGSHAARIEFILADLLHEAEKVPLMAKGDPVKDAHTAFLRSRVAAAKAAALTGLMMVDQPLPPVTDADLTNSTKP